ncbi:hypothetical protein Tco_0809942 [Tanacetum coccineum]
MHNVSVITKMIMILKTCQHGSSDAMHNPPNYSDFSQKKSVSFLTEFNTFYRLSHSEIIDIEKVVVRSSHVGIKSLLNAASITAAHIRVNVAQLC